MAIDTYKVVERKNDRVDIMTTIKRNINLRGLSRGLELLKLFQTIDDKVDVSCYAVFLLVCFQDGITNENILSYFPNMTKSRVSRTVHILCDVAKTRKFFAETPGVEEKLIFSPRSPSRCSENAENFSRKPQEVGKN